MCVFKFVLYDDLQVTLVCYLKIMQSLDFFKTLFVMIKKVDESANYHLCRLERQVM